MRAVRILALARDWLGRTLTRKFLLLLGGFLVLQAVQLATGIAGFVRLAEDTGVLDELDRQRVHLLVLAALSEEAVDAGRWGPGARQRFEATLGQADACFSSAKLPAALRDDPDLEAQWLALQSDWEAALRPLLLAVDPAGDLPGARLASARYRSLALAQAEQLDRLVRTLRTGVRSRAAAGAWIHAAVLAASLLLGGVGFLMARHLVSRPLARLIDATRSIASGAYERRLPVQSRDELGALAKNFNRMAEAVAERVARMRSFNKAAAALGSSLSLPETLQEALRRALEVCAARAAGIALVDPQTGNRYPPAALGLPGQLLARIGAGPVELAEEAQRRGAPVVASDGPGSPYPIANELRAQGIRCLLCVPLASHGAALGALYLYRAEPDSFREAEVEALVAFAALAAAAIANARLHEDVKRLAVTDRLTGLPNRHLFDEYLAHELARTRRERQPLALIVLDIDHFKSVNDNHGHAAGDQVLAAVAARVSASLRASDLAARYGGEELAVILPHTDAGSARQIAERIRATVAAAPIVLGGGRSVAVTLSAGVAATPSGEISAELLFERADEALYTAKREGRNRVFVYEETLKARLEREPAHLTTLLTEGLHHLPAILTALGAKAPFFRTHNDAVIAAAARLADALALSKVERETLKLAAALHDVGMVALPDEVLAHGRSLNECDWARVRSHATIGADLIGRAPGLEPVARIVRHHHERFDGTGYPDGLAGEAIPHLARVLAVADAFGAAAGGWVGRDAETDAKALAQVRAMAGRELDPAIVAALARSTATSSDAAYGVLDRAA